MSVAVLLVAHGTVDALDDLPAFLQNVRRGQPPSSELVAELRRRYEAIGGASPLNSINAEVARKLEQRMGVRVEWANRLWRPTVRERVDELAAAGVKGIALVALAQYSAHVYAADAREVARGHGLAFASAPNWGSLPSLRDAYASRIERALGGADRERTALLLTAHSLPKAVVDAGDPYERDVRSAAGAVLAELDARGVLPSHTEVAFQSQGLSTGPGGRPIAWLGPDLAAAMAGASSAGARHVVVAPIGFLADHVEVLYDLDVEARALASAKGITYARVPSLNADDDFIAVLAGVASPVVLEVSAAPA
jgi:ferrochelatase